MRNGHRHGDGGPQSRHAPHVADAGELEAVPCRPRVSEMPCSPANGTLMLDEASLRVGSYCPSWNNTGLHGSGYWLF
jgi:hypothetical protein